MNEARAYGGGRGGVVGRESRSLLSKIFHASPSPIAISRQADGTLIDVNEEWASFTGFEMDYAVGRTEVDLGLWADATARDDLLGQVESGEPVHEFETQMRTRAGEERTVLLSVQQIQVEETASLLTVMNDITEHNRTMQALQESEARFRMMADSAPVLIWLSAEDGARIYFNKPWLEFTGRSHEQERGTGWTENVHPEDRDHLLATSKSAIHRRADLSLEYRLRRQDGKFRYVLENGIPRYHPDGSFAGYIGSCFDINQQKETEQQLRAAKDEAEKMARLKSSFLTNITHEIRTPLTVILGFTSILRQGVRPEYQRFVNLIERSGRRLLLMLDSIIDLAQLESGSLETDQQPYNIVEVVDGVLTMVEPLAEEKGLTLKIDVPEERCYARGDHAVLTRILNNILDNAVKFTDRGGISVAIRTVDGKAQVTVRDTGVGIDERFLDHVFDPFVQESSGLDRTHQGSGLGLAVSKRLVELMGGSITVKSEKGKGSIFTITLPAVG